MKLNATPNQKRWGYQVSTHGNRYGHGVEPCDNTIPADQSRLTLRDAVAKLRDHWRSIGQSCWRDSAIYLDGHRVCLDRAVELADELEIPLRDKLRENQSDLLIPHIRAEHHAMRQSAEWTTIEFEEAR